MLLKNLQLILAISGICCLISACSKSNNSYSGNNPPPQGQTISVQVKNDAHFGKILTDEKGRTLYFFSLDANGNSACTGNCLVVWPVFFKDSATFDSSLEKTDFGSITRTDGSKQLTYKGWPLYYYQNDQNAGDILGDGVGSIWFVAKPDYTVMIVSGQLTGNDNIQYDSTYKPGTGNTRYLTTDRGVTLYSYSADKSGVNNYTASDFSNDSFWPIFQISTIGAVPSTIDKSWFATISVFGKTQMTFKGWPIYRFGPDSEIRGNTKGISVPQPGIWPVVDEYSPLAPE